MVFLNLYFCRSTKIHFRHLAPYAVFFYSSPTKKALPPSEYAVSGWANRGSAQISITSATSCQQTFGKRSILLLKLLEWVMQMVWPIPPRTLRPFLSQPTSSHSQHSFYAGNAFLSVQVKKRRRSGLRWGFLTCAIGKAGKWLV